MVSGGMNRLRTTPRGARNGCVSAWRALRPGGLLYCYGWPEYLAHVAVRFPVKKQRWLQWHVGQSQSRLKTILAASVPTKAYCALWEGASSLPRCTN